MQEAKQSPVLVMCDIHRVHRGRPALSGVSLEVMPGTVVGLVGPNGAGKSTLLALAAGFSWPDEGGGQVLSHSIGPKERPCPFVGFMPEQPAFIENTTARSNLRLLASIRGEIGREGVDAALSTVGLDPADRRPVRSYSQGMRQRLSLAQAVMERPALLLLDEPTNGLDAQGIVLLRETVRECARKGAAVLLASHLLSEVAAVSDRVVLIDGGKIVHDLESCAYESLEELYLATVGQKS